MLKKKKTKRKKKKKKQNGMELKNINVGDDPLQSFVPDSFCTTASGNDPVKENWKEWLLQKYLN